MKKFLTLTLGILLVFGLYGNVSAENTVWD